MSVREEEFRASHMSSICFADDTSTIATATEAPQADRILRETIADWEEKYNEKKKGPDHKTRREMQDGCPKKERKS